MIRTPPPRALEATVGLSSAAISGDRPPFPGPETGGRASSSRAVDAVNVVDRPVRRGTEAVFGERCGSVLLTNRR